MYRRQYRAAAFAILLLLPGCSSSTSPVEQTALAEAQARWEGHGFDHYTFDTSRQCFCPPEFTGPVRVEVFQQTIAGVRDLSADTLLDQSSWSSWYTVDDLFVIVKEAIESETFHQIDVQYDPALGYPAAIDLTAGEHIADADIRYEILLLVPQP